MHSETSVTRILLWNVFVLLGILLFCPTAVSEGGAETSPESCLCLWVQKYYCMTTRSLKIQRKGPCQYSKATSVGTVRTTIKGQFSSLLSLEHLKSLLTLDVVSRNDSKKTRIGTWVRLWRLQQGLQAKAGAAWQRPDVQLTWAFSSAFTAGAVPVLGFQFGDFFSLEKITTAIKIKRNVCVPCVCESACNYWDC